MLVLLGWFGHYALQYSGSGTIGLAAFVCLFLGIMWGDLLQCILEFSVFPVLDAIAPYALPGLADATYRSMPVSVLLAAGHFLLFSGSSGRSAGGLSQPHRAAVAGHSVCTHGGAAGVGACSPVGRIGARVRH